MGIRKVAKKEIKPLGISDLRLGAGDVGLQGSDTRIDQLSVPPAGKGAEWLEGKPEEIAQKVLAILKERGGLAQ
jgi:electron transfer flavoprotein alpha/beta subunit